MHADLSGALDQLNRSWKAFRHRDQPLTKLQVRKVLVYGLKKGYKTTEEFTDKEVDEVLAFNSMSPRNYIIEFAKEERHEIYKLAYSIFKADKYTAGMCLPLILAIEKLQEINVVSAILIELLPELNEIKPDKSKTSYVYWWPEADAETRNISFETMISQTAPVGENL
jgi:hypothetical protein